MREADYSRIDNEIKEFQAVTPTSWLEIVVGPARFQLTTSCAPLKKGGYAKAHSTRLPACVC